MTFLTHAVIIGNTQLVDSQSARKILVVSLKLHFPFREVLASDSSDKLLAI